MTSRSRALLVLGLGAALVAAVSCNTFDLPAETCNPTSLDARRDPGYDDNDCTRCLEDSCCDVVGRCQNAAGCAARVHDAQKCVLDAKLQGARKESECATTHDLAGLQEADDAYRCMRGACGAQCGLPVCKVDKAALLIRNARCDECFAGGCCAPLNSCYGSRACKLMLECIVNTCGSELGPALTGAKGTGGQLGVAARSGADIEAFCAPEAQGQAAGLPACIQACLCRYKDNDQGLPQQDVTQLPVNLAESVYRCGIEAECGPDCTPAPGEAGAR